MSDYWKDNGIEKPQQVVVCAACMHLTTKSVICSARHWDQRMRETYNFMLGSQAPAPTSRWEQGFIDQFGEFLTRKEALMLAHVSGQKVDMKRNGSASELHSEGLY